jgi:hypothetical protein
MNVEVANALLATTKVSNKMGFHAKRERKGGLKNA